MKIPVPEKTEEPKEFVSRCMLDDSMIKEYPNEKQRLAVCASNIKKK